MYPVVSQLSSIFNIQWLDRISVYSRKIIFSHLAYNFENVIYIYIYIWHIFLVRVCFITSKLPFPRKRKRSKEREKRKLRDY
jgi:hypothetical protein